MPELPKKLFPMLIYGVLKKYSDPDHRLTQKQIKDYLRKEYDVDLDSETIARNIKNLVDMDFDIDYPDKTRTRKGRQEEIITDICLLHEFTDSELRLIIDSLLFTKHHISNKQFKELINKVKGLSSIYFSDKMKHITVLTETPPVNKQIFSTIDYLDEAITKKVQVKFNYNNYDTDKKLYVRIDENGKPREYVVNPYQIVVTNGRYYLICNVDKYDDVSYFRLDRITGIKILENSRIKSMKQVQGLENGLDLPRHMAEHIYMLWGESGLVRFTAEITDINEILDWFGADITIKKLSDGRIEAAVTVNYDAMFYWCLQYPTVELIEPDCLRERLAVATRKMYEKYNKT